MERRMTRPQAEAGFNLIEAAIVLGIVGLIVGGIWMAAASAYNNMRLQSAASQILLIAQNARNVFSSNANDTSSVDGAAAVNLGLIPSNMIVNVSGTNEVHSPWGTTVDVTRGAGDSFVTIVLNDLSQAACTGLLTRLAAAGNGSGILVIDGGGTEVYNVSPGATDDTVSVADTTGACTGSAIDVTVTATTQ